LDFTDFRAWSRTSSPGEHGWPRRPASSRCGSAPADLGGDQARLEAVVALSYLAAAAAPAATSAVEDLIMSAAETLIGRI